MAFVLSRPAVFAVAASNYRIIKKLRGAALHARRGAGKPVGVWWSLAALCCSGPMPGFLDRHNGTLELAGAPRARSITAFGKPRGAAGAPCGDVAAARAKGAAVIARPGDGRHRSGSEIAIGGVAPIAAD